MSQAILISNNEVINSLYEVNLRAYVATNVTIKTSIAGAIQLLEQAPNIDVIICFRELNKTDNAIEKIQDYLKTKSLRIPIVVLGEPTHPVEKSIVIRNKYDIKGLLQSMAKILQISAKDMAEMQVPKFFPVPLKLFSSMETSHCDIFFRRELEDFEFEYFTIIEKQIPIGASLAKYIESGVKHLYIDAEERLRFINLASATMVDELERKDLTNEERVEITQQSMGIVAEEIFESQEVSEKMADVSKACIASISKTVKDMPKLRNLLKMLMEGQSEFIYKHSVISTYIASEIIDNISWGSKEQKDKISFAIFFHDLFLVPIYKKYPDIINEEDLLFNEDVEDEHKNIVMEHAKMAGDLVRTFPRCPMGADMIITQHHGMTSGVGFAVNYKDDISPLSKIMIIAEEITLNVLISMDEKGETEKLSVNKEAIILILSEKFRNHTYKKIIEAFKKVKI
jgi:hypothetical protein